MPQKKSTSGGGGQSAALLSLTQAEKRKWNAFAFVLPTVSLLCHCC